MICSRCGRKLETIAIRIEQRMDVYKITEQGVFQPTGNLSEPTNEYLCDYCFDKYAECLDSLNQDYNGKLLVDMVEVIDDIQYGE